MNYQAMKEMAENPEFGFYSVIQEYKGATYEIFSYRLCSYTDFFNDKYSQDDTLNMRGTMFRIDTPKPELVCLPLPKFFNDNENPYTMDLDYTKAVDVVEKIDGSLISTFIDAEGELAVKSKTSLFSSQAKAAELILRFNAECFEYIKFLTKQHTVNFEYCAPDNRIVLYYPYRTLYGISLRNKKNGDMLSLHEFPEFSLTTVESHNDLLKHGNDLVKYVHCMEGMEGYVVHFPDRLVKIKTDWYVRRHHAKDNVYNLRNLADIILHEQVDDLHQLFEDDQTVLDHINYYEKHFIDKFNKLYKRTEKFWLDHKNLERKEYAILGQKELGKPEFKYAMNFYLNRPVEEQMKQDIVKQQPAFEEISHE